MSMTSRHFVVVPSLPADWASDRCRWLGAPCAGWRSIRRRTRGIVCRWCWARRRRRGSCWPARPRATRTAWNCRGGTRLVLSEYRFGDCVLELDYRVPGRSRSSRSSTSARTWRPTRLRCQARRVRLRAGTVPTRPRRWRRSAPARPWSTGLAASADRGGRQLCARSMSITRCVTTVSCRDEMRRFAGDPRRRRPGFLPGVRPPAGDRDGVSHRCSTASISAAGREPARTRRAAGKPPTGCCNVPARKVRGCAVARSTATSACVWSIASRKAGIRVSTCACPAMGIITAREPGLRYRSWTTRRPATATCKPYQFSASLYAIAPAAARDRPARPALEFAGHPLRGRHYTITHNGQVVLDVSRTGLSRAGRTIDARVSGSAESQRSGVVSASAHRVAVIAQCRHAGPVFTTARSGRTMSARCVHVETSGVDRSRTNVLSVSVSEVGEDHAARNSVPCAATVGWWWPSCWPCCR